MSVSGDMTGIAGVWITGKKVSIDDDPSKDLSFRLAFSVSVKAPKGRQISFEKNRKFVVRKRQETAFSSFISMGNTQNLTLHIVYFG
jgi:hypothetical protein